MPPRDTTSLWQPTAPARRFPRLDRDLEVDAVVAGAGISGVTAALLLVEAGWSVALFDMRDVGSGETGRSTAHLTELLDTRTHVLEKRLGREEARFVANAVRAAMARVKRWVSQREVHCGLAHVPGYLYSEEA